MAIIRNVLDSRIKDFNDIQSFTQYSDEYVGKSGYFSDTLCRFQDLKSCHKHTLININDDEEAGDFIFECKGGNYRYFLPESLLKSEKKEYKPYTLAEKKKYRPYTLAEWIEQHNMGDIVHFRNKKSGTVYCGMYVGNVRLKDTDIDNSSEGMLSLGVDNFALEYLFEDYEIEIDGEWLPFGIEE